MIASSVALAVLGILLFAAAVLAAQDRLLRRRAKARIVVTMKSGSTFSGLLHEVDGRTVVLRNAQALDPADGSGLIVDGELLLARPDIDYLQRP